MWGDIVAQFVIPNELIFMHEFADKNEQISLKPLKMEFSSLARIIKKNDKPTGKQQDIITITTQTIISQNEKLASHIETY